MSVKELQNTLRPLLNRDLKASRCKKLLWKHGNDLEKAANFVTKRLLIRQERDAFRKDFAASHREQLEILRIMGFRPRPRVLKLLMQMGGDLEAAARLLRDSSTSPSFATELLPCENFVVDGNNVLQRGWRNTTADHQHLLCELMERLPKPAIVVFDGDVPCCWITSKSNLVVVFHSGSRTADDLVVQDLLWDARQETVLVTSDRVLAGRVLVRAPQTRVMRSARFMNLLGQTLSAEERHHYYPIFLSDLTSFEGVI
jgi:hypothetical protein